MKLPSDELFKLIKSLTKSEKRYFKLFTKIHVKGEQNNYIKVFDTIEKQKIYNEEKIKKKFEGDHFISYFPVEKIQLYNLIMRSLIVYGSSGDIEAELSRDLGEVRILFRKGLYDQALKVIEKAKEKSIQHERFCYGTELEKWRMKVLYQKGVGFDQEHIYKGFAFQYDLLKKEKNFAEYMEVQAKLFSFLRMFHDVRSAEEFKKIKRVIDIPLQSNENLALTAAAKKLFHSNLSLYYHFIGNHKKHYEENKILVALYKKESIGVYNYFSALVNFFNSCVLIGKFDSCVEIIKEIERLSVSKVFSEQRKFSTLFLLKLTLCLSTNSFDEALALVKGNERKILSIRSNIASSSYVIIVYKIIYIYFIKGMYSDALKWFNNYFNKITRDAIRKDVESIAKILYLVLHFELENVDLVEYQIKSTYRWFLKQERLYKFEKTILGFIRLQLPKVDNEKKMIGAFKKLKGELEELKADKFERIAFDFFDIVSWLESKIEGKTFEKKLIEKK